ncbi:MAG: CHAT domain-containing protein [Deltaproteobacteria bacterium]|jgi:CHAT domain-containing protein|nr:CHAT domain-containing protein [Deltaproteobacteria bacterium]
MSNRSLPARPDKGAPQTAIPLTSLALSSLAVSAIALFASPLFGDAVARETPASGSLLSGVPDETRSGIRDGAGLNTHGGTRGVPGDDASQLASYRPAWDFEPMAQELETLRVEAESLTGGTDRLAEAGAWSRLESSAAEAYGPGDLRAMAAGSRRARAVLLFGVRDWEAFRKAGADAATSEAHFAKALGDSSPEALFAAETAARFLMEEGYGVAARNALLAMAERSSAALGPDHPQTLSALDGARLLARYRPAWNFEPMTPGIESLREDAQRLAGLTDRRAEAEAWGRTETAAAVAYGPDDPRARAAASRRARAVLLYGDRGSEAFGDAGRDAAEAEAFFSEALGEASPEALYAAETAARISLAEGHADAAKDALRGAAERSVTALGPAHPQTLSARRGAALASALAAADASGWNSIPDSEKAFLRERTTLLDIVRDGLLETAKAAERDLADVPFATARSLGEGHPETQDARHEAGLGLGVIGRHRAAAAMFRLALEDRRELAGVDSPEALSSLNGLASELLASGDASGALEAFSTALAGRDALLGPGHPDALASADGLGSALLLLGRADEARERFSQARAGREAALGPADRETLASADGEAMALLYSYDFPAAADRLSRSLLARMGTLPNGSAAIANSRILLAGARAGARDPAAATAVLAAAPLAPRRGRQGESAQVSSARNGRAPEGAEPRIRDTPAVLPKDLDDHRRARDYYQGAMETLEAAQGASSLGALRARLELADALHALGEYGKARSLYAMSVSYLADSLGEDHPRTLVALTSFGEAVDAEGLEPTLLARNLLRHAASGLETALGPDAPETLTAFHCLGKEEYGRGELAAAGHFLGLAAAGREKVLGTGHPDTLRTLTALSSALLEAGDCPSARSLAERALAGFTELGWGAGPEIPDASEALAAALLAAGEPAESARLYGRASAARTGQTGRRKTEEILKSEYGRAGALLAVGYARDALDIYRDVPALIMFTDPGLLWKAYVLAAQATLGDNGEAAGLAMHFMPVGSDAESIRIKDALWPVVAAWLKPGGHGENVSDDYVMDLIRADMSGRDYFLGDSHPDAIRGQIVLSGYLADGGSLEDARDRLIPALSRAIRLRGRGHPLAALAAAELGGAYAGLGDRRTSVFYLKTAAEALAENRGRLPWLDPALRRDWLASAGDACRDLAGALLREGRTGEALGVLDLLKDHELSLLLPDAPAPGAKPGTDGRARPAGPTRPDLFAGTPEGAARYAYLAAVGADEAASRELPQAPGTPAVDGQDTDGLHGNADGPDTDGIHSSDDGPDAESLPGADGWPDAESLPGADSGLNADDDLSDADGNGSDARQSAGNGHGSDDMSAYGNGPDAYDESSWDSGQHVHDGESFGYGPAPPEPAGPEIRALQDFCASLPSLLGGGSERGAVADVGAARLRVRQMALSRKGAAGVLYAVSAEDALHLVLITPRATIVKETPIARKELAALAKRYRALLEDPAKDPRPVGKALHDALLAPLEAEIETMGAGTLLFSLDGPLRHVPPAALWDGEAWLAERRPTAVAAPSAMDGPAAPAIEGRASIEALGVTREEAVNLIPTVPPDLAGRPAYAGAAEELAALAEGGADSGAPRITPVLDGDFTRDALHKSLASGAAAVHVAVPFRLFTAGLDGTEILLGDGDTEALTEILSATGSARRKPELLTFSLSQDSCGLAWADGREVEGLGEAARRAGVPAMLASLWRADGPSSAALSREFYRLRYGMSLGKAEALQKAQVNLMRTASTPDSSESVPASESVHASEESAEAGQASVDCSRSGAPSEHRPDSGADSEGEGDAGASPGEPADAGTESGEYITIGNSGSEGKADMAVTQPDNSSDAGAQSGESAHADESRDGGNEDETAASEDGTDLQIPSWDGTGFSHPYFWARLVLLGDWS